jgi:putative selenate reductase molybdopterin-binding subunit
MSDKDFTNVGKSIKKIDGYSLAQGKAKFVDDFELRDVLHVEILKSPHAHARIKSIDVSEALKIEGVREILHYKNTPKKSHTTAGQGYPEPSPYDTYMFDEKVRFVGDRVAAVGADNREIAKEALKKIKVEYEVLEPVLDFEKAWDEGQAVIHEKDISDGHFKIYNRERNHSAHVEVNAGDFDKAYSKAEKQIEGLYRSHYAQHCPIEPHACLSYLDERDRLVIVTSTQVPFHARRICSRVLDIPVQNIRIIKPRIGGGFGVKQEVFLEYIAGLITLRTKRPAKIIYTRTEELISSRTRHPHTMWIKTGLNGNKIDSISLHALSNTGAYGSHALTVVSNAGSKTLPIYNKIENVRFIGDAVYSNLPVGGAYRGYGATQGAFALEVHMDRLAYELKEDPIEFRKRHLIRNGESSPIFKKLGEGKEGVEMTLNSVNIHKCIEIGAKEIDWENKKKRNRKIENSSKYRGIGVCTLMQGSSIPYIDMGGAYLKLNEDGSFNLHIGATDLGTGSDTILAQIAAEELQTATSKMIVYSSDTDFTPFDVGAYASSTTYLSGMAVRKAAENIKKEILDYTADLFNEPKQDLYIKDGIVYSKYSDNSMSYSDVAKSSLYSLNQKQITGVASHFTKESPPPFLACFADIEIDIETGVITLKEIIAAIDCGTAINPKLAEGQVEGAVMNAASSVLSEEYIFDNKGKMLNSSFRDYKIFTAKDLPKFKTILVESYEPTGPFGAKSVSEIGQNASAPVISNAVYDAIGVRLTEQPFTPERVLQEIKKQFKN